MLRGYNFHSRFNCLNRRLHSVQTAFLNAAVSQSGVRWHLHFQNDFLQTCLQPFCESRCCRLSVLFSVFFFSLSFPQMVDFIVKKQIKEEGRSYGGGERGIRRQGEMRGGRRGGWKQGDELRKRKRGNRGWRKRVEVFSILFEFHYGFQI